MLGHLLLDACSGSTSTSPRPSYSSSERTMDESPLEVPSGSMGSGMVMASGPEIAASGHPGSNTVVGHSMLGLTRAGAPVMAMPAEMSGY